MSRLKAVGWLAVLMAAGLLLRLPLLRLGLWRDEASTYFDVVPATLGAMIHTVATCELNPPGFFLIMRQWVHVFGAGDVAFKVPALLFGLSMIPAAYLLGSTAGSRATGLIAAGFATFAPQAVYFSQEARPYSLAALLCCCTGVAFLKALRGRCALRDLAWFVVWASLFVYVQYTGLLVVVALAIAAAGIALRRESGVRWIPLGLAFAAIGLLFAPWLPTFLVHLRTGTPWAQSVPFAQMGALLVHNVLYTIPLAGVPRSLLLAGVLAGAIAMIATHSRASTDRVAHAPILLLVVVAVLIGLETALSFGGRYLFPLAPLAWVLYAQFALGLWHRMNRVALHSVLRVALRVSVTGLVAWSLVVPGVKRALSRDPLPKSGIRSLAADLDRSPLQSTVLVVAPDYLGPTFGYYGARSQTAPFYGFARWDRPQLFTPGDYAAIWNNPAIVFYTERRIHEEAVLGARSLALVWEDAPARLGRMPFGKTQELVAALSRTYALRKQVTYRGTQESVTLSVFSLGPQRQVRPESGAAVPPRRPAPGHQRPSNPRLTQGVVSSPARVAAPFP